MQRQRRNPKAQIGEPERGFFIERASRKLADREGESSRYLAQG